MTTTDALDAVLEFLHRERGVDFARFKRAGLERRVGKRLAALGMGDHAAYLRYLKAHSEELTALFNTLLVNVTAFFRDPEAWETLRCDILPSLLASRTHGPLRAWSAGCATGEEPYSIAIVLSELLGEDELLRRVKVYATDVDDDALQHARRGVYRPRDVASLPPAWVEKYFVGIDGNYEVRSTLRRCVVFGRHDLLKDPPISRIDLLACRNTLMYLNTESQAKVLGHLRFALNDGAVLVLGRAETILSDSEGFAPLHFKKRIFSARPGPASRSAIYPVMERDPALLPAAYDAGANAQVLIGANGALLMANARARETFGWMATRHDDPGARVRQARPDSRVRRDDEAALRRPARPRPRRGPWGGWGGGRGDRPGARDGPRGACDRRRGAQRAGGGTPWRSHKRSWPPVWAPQTARSSVWRST
ncbi:MAG TPA: protein-glutamate O-methyltransferase CheR [Polyangiaceae bacterium]|jgi:two-component system CheB/CheR fusion protein